MALGGFTSPAGGGVCPGRSVRPGYQMLPTPRLVLMSWIPVIKETLQSPPLTSRQRGSLSPMWHSLDNRNLEGVGLYPDWLLPRGDLLLVEHLSLGLRFLFLTWDLSLSEWSQQPGSTDHVRPYRWHLVEAWQDSPLPSDHRLPVEEN